MLAHIGREGAREIGIILILLAMGLFFAFLVAGLMGSLAAGNTGRRMLGTLAGFVAGIVSTSGFGIAAWQLSQQQGMKPLIFFAPVGGIVAAYLAGYMVSKSTHSKPAEPGNPDENYQR